MNKETCTLVTGAAGFIGFHVALRLLAAGESVVGIDYISDSYDLSLKEARLRILDDCGASRGGTWTFIRGDLASEEMVRGIFKRHHFEHVMHLAAEAGVRRSLNQPQSYVHSNIAAFTNLLEACRHHSVSHLIYASSSSVYGASRRLPSSERDSPDHPLQLYAATKRANELMAHAYSHLFRLPTTGLRLFTVYGPWARPDMAIFRFTRAILAGEPIEVFNEGRHTRDFTYIDDVVESFVRTSRCIPGPDLHWDAQHPNPATSDAPYRIMNVGSGCPVSLAECIDALEKTTGMQASMIFSPLQPGDVVDTQADVSALHGATGYRPGTPFSEGIRRFVMWYREYYRC